MKSDHTSHPSNQRPLYDQASIEHFVAVKHAGQSKLRPEQCKGVKNFVNLGESKIEWKHIEVCKDNQCTRPHCVSSRVIFAHYTKCRLSQCETCAPIKGKLKALAFKEQRILKREARAAQHNSTDTTSGGISAYSYHHLTEGPLAELNPRVALSESTNLNSNQAIDDHQQNELQKDPVRDNLRRKIKEMTLRSLSSEVSLTVPIRHNETSEEIALQLEQKIFERNNTRAHSGLSDIALSAAIAVMLNDQQSESSLERAMQQLNI